MGRPKIFMTQKSVLECQNWEAKRQEGWTRGNIVSAGSQARSCTFLPGLHAAPQESTVTWWESSHNGDVMCDLRAEGCWLGITSTDDPETLKREEGALEVPLMGPCSEEGKGGSPSGIS